ncbi:YggS family pyridoxal phosphate enzyme [Corynebacterium sp. BCW_4722]|nr:YggS family pyridoxal phosphate enzyme [Corynebacterium sp. BCW_4722]
MIAQRYAEVTRQILEAEAAAGRPAGSVQLLPVTKFHPVDAIRELAELGVELVGENREQEARQKAEQLNDVCRIAMIGQIQSKKANAVARWASEVHSLDSVKLAEGLERGMALALERGDRTTATLPCMVQLSADGDTARGGAAVETVPEIVAAVEGSEHLELAGFMVVPPLESDPREVFDSARATTDEYASTLKRNLRLSAGMSGDFELAIASGSDIVRVGTAVLGPRPVG